MRDGAAQILKSVHSIFLGDTDVRPPPSRAARHGQVQGIHQHFLTGETHTTAKIWCMMQPHDEHGHKEAAVMKINPVQD
jgi:hypothetical protein